jgi:hypothetical protein
MMVIVVNGLWNEEIFERLTLKYRIQNACVFEEDLRAFAGALNSILRPMQAMGSREGANGLIILSNEGNGVIINNLCYGRIL